MGARTATGEPANDGSESGPRSALARAAMRLPRRLSEVPLGVSPLRAQIAPLRARLRRPAPVVLAIAAAAVAVASVAALTYYSAQEFSGRAADARASSEAMSFAQHSSRLATGDAFDGYIQILRYADDPVLNAKSSTANERAQAMQRLLYVSPDPPKRLALEP